ncbi:SMI1/KNR4 family protein [Candidatus Tisiphia endosymbiont of Hybos culiciformis]|uniref:SMI1/KNR4 family protein n=1 Tax=Candidatus Tisiphia endosymbiont of Hybos culiciformis TaxID=3139331 RepID=UPI003CCA8680
MKRYNYLEKFINNSNTPAPRNSFTKTNFQDVKNAEDKLGFEFPESLKIFWLEIGSGVLSKSINGNSALCYANYILRPNEIADIMILKEESDYILPEAVEYIEEGYIKSNDIIFFEIGDMSSFLVMKPGTDKPDAVYDMLGRLVEEHFEKFIWRLYHESPDYYLHVNKVT